MGGGPISRKKRYVTLEWPLILYCQPDAQDLLVNITLFLHSNAKIQKSRLHFYFLNPMTLQMSGLFMGVRQGIGKKGLSVPVGFRDGVLH